MSQDEISEDRKEEYIEKLRRTGRSNATFETFLEKSGFFTSPASTRYHEAYEGGLVEHSLKVYEATEHLLETVPFSEIDPNAAYAVALLHDVCKVGIYRKVVQPASRKSRAYAETLIGELPSGAQSNQRWVSNLIEWARDGKAGTMPEEPPQFERRDPWPIGHGEKSAIILAGLPEMSKDELLAVRWHMGPWDNPAGFSEAREVSPLVTLIHLADMMATTGGE